PPRTSKPCFSKGRKPSERRVTNEFLRGTSMSCLVSSSLSPGPKPPKAPLTLTIVSGEGDGIQPTSAANRIRYGSSTLPSTWKDAGKEVPSPRSNNTGFGRGDAGERSVGVVG